MERGGWSGSGREKGADAWRKGGGMGGVRVYKKGIERIGESSGVGEVGVAIVLVEEGRRGKVAIKASG